MSPASCRSIASVAHITGLVLAFALMITALGPTQARAQAISPGEARTIARDACIYGFPLVDSYRILYSYFVDRSSPEYKADWNEEVANTARVFTPDGKAMQTPNADTPYL